MSSRCLPAAQLRGHMDASTDVLAASAENLHMGYHSARAEGDGDTEMSDVRFMGGASRRTRWQFRLPPAAPGGVFRASAEGTDASGSTTGDASNTGLVSIDTGAEYETFDGTLAQQYDHMVRRVQADALCVRRSRIHGWGLFTRVSIPKDGMVVEYVGEAVGQCLADIRERLYESHGQDSCYMFRLHRDAIVDATYTGNFARFINHCCDVRANYHR